MLHTDMPDSYMCGVHRGDGPTQTSRVGISVSAARIARGLRSEIGCKHKHCHGDMHCIIVCVVWECDRHDSDMSNES